LNKKNEELNGEFLNNSYIPGITLGKYNLSWEESDCCLTPTQQFFKLIFKKMMMMMMSALY
jgi:hypothetical protein